MNSSSEKSLKLPTFNGEKEDFAVFWMRFSAYATVYDFVMTLVKGGEPDLPASADEQLDPTKDADKKKIAARKRNNVAIANMTMAFSTQAMLALIEQSCTDKWPSGLAYVVMELLFARFRPDDVITRVELRKQLAKVSMKVNAKPSTLFEQISSIRNRFNKGTRKVDEEELIATVLEKAPKEYQAVLTCEQRVKGNAVKLEDLEDAMTEHYRVIEAVEDNEDEGDDIALSAFNGTCYKCGFKGHRAKDCRVDKSKWKKNSNSNKPRSSRMKCYQCGKPGHRQVDCWEREENKHKRPSNWKSKEHGAAAIESKGEHQVEFLLCGVCNDEAMEFPKSHAILRDPNLWIGDTGATTHMSRHKQGMTNLRKAEEGDSVTMGNGGIEVTNMIGDIPGTICDKHGKQLESTALLSVSYVPTCQFNLFSIPKMMKQGWILGGDAKNGIFIKKGNHVVRFDIVVPTKNGLVFGMYLKRDTEVAGTAQENKPVKLTIQEVHNRLGHCDEDKTRKIATSLGWELVPGALGPCEACAAGKGKQKNVPKNYSDDDKKPIPADENRVFLDLATLKRRKGDPKATKPNWRIMVTEREQLKFSDFFKTKDGMVEPTCVQLNLWKQAGKGVSHMRLDNAGENKKLQNRSNSKDWKLGISFEETARDTPQQNSLAEKGFSTIACRGRAMMNIANVPKEVRFILWIKAFDTAGKLDGLVQIEIDGVTQSRYKHWTGKDPVWANHLRTWGEAGTVKVSSKMTPKVLDRGIQCMFVGYPNNHAGDVYEMWDPKTKRVRTTRDIIWLHRMYYQKPAILSDYGIGPIEFVTDAKNKKQDGNAGNVQGTRANVQGSSGTVQEVSQNAKNVEADSEEAGEGNEQEDELEDTLDKDDEAEEQEASATRSGRAVKAPGRLIEEMGGIAAGDEYEIGLTQAEAKYYEAMKAFPEGEFRPGEMACVGAGIGGGFTSTEELHVMKYDEAMETPDVDKWEKSVDEEHDRMEKNQVFEVTPRDEVPEGAKILTSTWAMKKKASGRFRARLNARGYEQVDGEHYDEDAKSAPVVSEATIMIVFILMVMAGWVAHVIDVKGAFLHGVFEKGRKVYMEVPQGFEKFYPGNVVLLLLKTLYGTKQAARAFWNMLCKAMLVMKYARSKADPCLHFAWTKAGLVLWLSWVDDCIVMGPQGSVLIAKEEMKKQFDCEDIGEIIEYIGCKVDYDKDERWVKLTQPVLMQSFTDEFDLPDEAAPKTPAPGGQV